MSDFPFDGYRFSDSIDELMKEDEGFSDYMDEMLDCLQDDYSELDEDATLSEYFVVPSEYIISLGTDNIWIRKEADESIIRVFTDND